MRVFWQFILALLCVTAGSQCDANLWTVQTIDQPPAGYQTGLKNSLRLDSSGNAAIAYWMGSSLPDKRLNSTLKFARLTGQTWQTCTVDNQGTVGGFPSLAFDSLDRPHISYDDFGNLSLKYASWDGSAWQTQTVFSVDCRETSLVLDSSDNPRIAYHNYSDGYVRNLEYVSWDGSSWSRQTVDATPGVGMYLTMVLDSLERPRIGYHDNSSGTLNGGVRYALWNGSEWVIEVVDRDFIKGCSFALDAEGRPHFSYYGRIGNAFYLKHACWTGTQWVVQPLELAYNGYNYGVDTSIVVGADGVVRIAFEGGDHPMTRVVKFGYLDSSGWHSETVDTYSNNAAYGVGRSIALDSEGNVHMSYQAGWALKYAFRPIPEPSSLATVLVGAALCGLKTARRKNSRSTRSL